MTELLREHPVLPPTNIKEIERMFRLHPSLVCASDLKRLDEYRKRKDRAKMLRQLGTCKAHLSEFAGSVDNLKARALLLSTCDFLADSIWILKEDGEGGQPGVQINLHGLVPSHLR